VLVFRAVTDLDWVIILFAAGMGYWGYRHGLIVGLLSLCGFAAGAFLGGRLAPALLPDGSHSPYAPATALAGALLVGGIVAVSLEGVAIVARRRLLGPAGRHPLIAAGEATGGAMLLVAVALGVSWLIGAVALNAPGAGGLREAVQRSAILQALNEGFPPSGFIINALHRIDPGISVQGPQPAVGPPDSRLARDPQVLAGEDSVVQVLGTACGLGVEGSGWIAAPGLVVTNAHVVAGESDTSVSPSDSDERLDATPVHYEPRNDLALLQVDGLDGPPLALAGEVAAGPPGAVLGYPENGPFHVAPARVGQTAPVVTQDSYGHGPVARLLTALRGEVRSGNSGGPLLDGDGQVMATVFAATTQGKPGGYGIPNEVVSEALTDSAGEADTGPCTR
jgi:S1-C subfamily serine protease